MSKKRNKKKLQLTTNDDNDDEWTRKNVKERQENDKQIRW